MDFENMTKEEIEQQYKIVAGLVMREYEICLEKFRKGDFKWAMLSEDMQNEKCCEAFLRGLIWCKMVLITRQKYMTPEAGSPKLEEKQDLVEMVGRAVMNTTEYLPVRDQGEFVD